MYIYRYVDISLFMLSPQWNSMHWLRDPQKRVVHSGIWKFKRLSPNLHASISVHFSAHFSSTVTHNTHRRSSSSPLWRSGWRQLHTCVSPHSAAWFAQSWASFISDWPITVTPSDGVTRICTKAAVFFCLHVKWCGCPAVGEVTAMRQVRANTRQKDITLTLHVLLRPLTYALLIFK